MDNRVGWGRLAGARALLLGTGSHLPESQSGLPTVPAVATTVADLNDVLVERCGLPAESITTGVDLSSVEEMGELIATTAEAADDLLVVYYVGHGVVTSTGQLHLATTRTRDGGDRALHTALPYATLGGRVRQSAAHHRVVILDCCFSARALDAASGLGEPDQVVAGQTEIPGGFVLTSAGRFQASLAPPGARHTLFTGALIRLLRDGDPDGPAQLTLDGLWRGAVRAMRQMTPPGQATLPMPRCRADGDLGQLVLAANPAYRPPPGDPATSSRLSPQPPSGTGLCPYRGLAAFDVGDARWFHGRTRLTGELVQALGERYHLTGRPAVLVGASGAGKSSLLRAGLLPALARGDLGVAGSSTWPVRVFTPTADPLAALAVQVASLTAAPVDSVVAAVRGDPGSVVAMLRQGLTDALGMDLATPARVVLVVDQFEEVFTLARQDTDGGGQPDHDVFLHALAASAAGDGSGAPAALVVLGMRADVYGRCAEHPVLARLLRDPPVLVSAMTVPEILDAIQRPAQDAGLVLEDGLVELLLADLGADRDADGPSGGDQREVYEPGRLPLLSHALRATWQHKHDQQLTLNGYRRTGGITQALATTADAVLADITSRHGAHGRGIAEQILTRLVHVTTNSEPARLRVARDRLLSGLPQPTAQQVLHMLTSDRARIVTTGAQPDGTDGPGDTVEITHDALLRQWPTLSALIDRDRSVLLVEGDLRAAAERWHTTGRDSDLYQGDDLAAARKLSADPIRRARLSPDLRLFLDASIRHDRKRRRRRTAGVAALTIALVTALISATVAGWQWRTANEAARTALSRQLAAQSDALFDINPDLASLLAVEATTAAPTTEAHRSLAKAANRPLRRTLTGHTKPVSDVVFSPDGTRLATASDDGTARLWDARTGAPLATFTGHTEPGGAVVFSPDGTRLATASSDRTARVWDARTGAPLAILTGHTAPVSAVVFSPDGTQLASASADGTARLWDARTGAPLATFTGHTGVVYAVVFSPDGTRLATAGEDGTVRLWDARTRLPLSTLTGHTAPVWEVVFSPDGTRLATASADGTARLWDARADAPLSTLTRHTGDVHAVVFSPDGTRLATTSNDRTARLWDARTGAELSTLAGHTGDVTGVVFSPDGTRLATASGDGTVRLWDVRTGAPLSTLTGHTAVSAVVFSPDGTRLATASNDGTARLWDPPQWESPTPEAVCRAVNRDLSRQEWDQYLPAEPYRRTCSSS